MKTFLAILTFSVLGLNANAATCPNLTGNYRSGTEIPWSEIDIVQTGCESIQKTWMMHGLTSDFNLAQTIVYVLDGETHQSEDVPGAVTRASFTNTVLNLETIAYGVDQNVQVSLDSASNLVWTYGSSATIWERY